MQPNVYHSTEPGQLQRWSKTLAALSAEGEIFWRCEPERAMGFERESARGWKVLIVYHRMQLHNLTDLKRRVGCPTILCVSVILLRPGPDSFRTRRTAGMQRGHILSKSA